MARPSLTKSLWLPVIAAGVSAGLGVAINLATDLKSNWIAWVGVGILTLAAAAVGVAAHRSSSLAGGGQDGAKPANAQHASVIVGNQKTHLGDRNTWAGGVHYHGLPLRAVGVFSAILWLTAATGLVGGAILVRQDPAAVADASKTIPPTIAVSNVPPPVQPGTIALTAQTHYYYPDNGVLPKVEPPTYSNQSSHCAAWADWARSVNAAPTGNYLRVDALASTSAPITILSARFQVYSKRQIAGHDRIQCQYGFGGFGGTTLYPDLDHPTRPVPMDTDNDSKPDTTLPGGFFVVDPNKAEPLNIIINGSKGQIYNYSVTFDVVENGARKTVSFGDEQHPLLLAFEEDDRTIPNQANGSPNDSAKYFDWDFGTRNWAPAPTL